MGLGTAAENAMILQSAGDSVVCGTAVFPALFTTSAIQVLDESGLSRTVRNTGLDLPEDALPAAVVRDARCVVRNRAYAVREVQPPDANGWVHVVLVEA